MIVNCAALPQPGDALLKHPENTGIVRALYIIILFIYLFLFGFFFVFRFDPSRFSKENGQKRSQFWFSPFGFGVRQCQSHHFTYAAATVFMVTLLRKFRFHVIDKSQVMTPVYGLVTHLKEEIFISLTAR